MKNRPDLSGTARCSDCNATATYPTPGDPASGPLVIHHADWCSVVTIGTSAVPDDEAGLNRLLAALDAVPTRDLDGPARVVVDERYGHIGVVGPHGTGQAQVTFADVGSVLSLWSYQGLDLDPELARSLGKALVAWADKKNPPPFDLMVTLTGDALTDLLTTTGEWDDDLHTLRLALDDGTFKIKANESHWSMPLTDGVLIQEGHDIP